MSIYTIGQLKASFVSGGLGDYWENASDGDAVCMYVRLIQEGRQSGWNTVNVQDTARYLGVSEPRTCPKTSLEVNSKVREKSESFLKGLFGEVLEINDDVKLQSTNSDFTQGHTDFVLSFFLVGFCAFRGIKK